MSGWLLLASTVFFLWDCMSLSHLGHKTNSRLWATDGQLSTLGLTCPAALRSQGCLRAAAPKGGGHGSKCSLGTLPTALGLHPSPLWPPHPMSGSLLGVIHLLQGPSVPAHRKESFPWKSLPAATVMVSVNETVFFTLARGPLTFPSCGL